METFIKAQEVNIPSKHQADINYYKITNKSNNGKFKMMKLLTETYIDRFKWKVHFFAAGCCACFFFLHLLNSTQKHVGHHLKAQRAIH